MTTDRAPEPGAVCEVCGRPKGDMWDHECGPATQDEHYRLGYARETSRADSAVKALPDRAEEAGAVRAEERRRALEEAAQACDLLANEEDDGGPGAQVGWSVATRAAECVRALASSPAPLPSRQPGTILEIDTGAPIPGAPAPGGTLTEHEVEELRAEASAKYDHPTKPTPLLMNPSGVLLLIERGDGDRRGAGALTDLLREVREVEQELAPLANAIYDQCDDLIAPPMRSALFDGVQRLANKLLFAAEAASEQPRAAPLSVPDASRPEEGRRPIAHIAGPMLALVQHCSRCDAVLCDYRRAEVMAGSGRLSGWTAGATVAVLGGASWLVTDAAPDQEAVQCLPASPPSDDRQQEQGAPRSPSVSAEERVRKIQRESTNAALTGREVWELIREEISASEAARDTLWREAVGHGTPWTAASVLEKLADAADHLLDVHNCDSHGYELVQGCVKRARDYALAIRRALLGAAELTPEGKNA